MFPIRLLVLPCAALWAAAAAGPVQAGDPLRDQVRADWKALHVENERLTDKIFKHIDFRGNLDHDLATNLPKALALFEDFAKADLENFNRQWTDFGARYGDTADAAEKTIRKLAGDDLPDGVPNTAGFLFDKVEENLKKYAFARKDVAAGVCRQVGYDLGNAGMMLNPNEPGKFFRELDERLALAAGFDPANADVAAMRAQVDELRKVALAEAEKKIDILRWPGDVARVNGTTSVADLRAAAAARWANPAAVAGGYVPGARLVAVCVRGDWYSARKNILDETIQWRLPVWVAVTNDQLAAENVAMVFDCSMATREERGVAMAPPFAAAVIGQPFKMRLSNVPTTAGAGSAGSTTTSGSAETLTAGGLATAAAARSGSGGGWVFILLALAALGATGVAVTWYLGFVPVLPELREKALRVVQRKG
jgi:hypothetical protein